MAENTLTVKCKNLVIDEHYVFDPKLKMVRAIFREGEEIGPYIAICSTQSFIITLSYPLA